ADLRSNSMFGSYSGTDCQGAHANGSFSMTKGLVPIAPAPTAAPTASSTNLQFVTQYGTPSELRGVRTVFIYGVDADVRNNMLKQFDKHPELRVVGEIEKADVVLVFGGQVFSMGTHTSVWTDANGNGWASTSPRYGVSGQGSAVKFVLPNTIRIVWQF